MQGFAGVKYVFLDRDGVLNRKPPEGEYVTRPEELELLPGAAEAVALLNQSGCTVLVVTNQRGVALGRYTLWDLSAIHDRMRQHLAKASAHIDAIYACPHDKGECECRKPGTGLLEQGFSEFPSARPENSVLIGDSLSDIQAGRAAGMRTIFIEGDAATRKAGSDEARGLADAASRSLLSAVKHLLLTAM